MNMIERAGLGLLHRLDPEQAHDLTRSVWHPDLIKTPMRLRHSRGLVLDLSNLVA